jgi:membrane metallo-endopeptidase-like protein 1
MERLLDTNNLESAGANLISSSSDHLCEPGLETSSVNSDGRVRFVNSTVRYHMGSGATSLWTSRTRLEQILLVVLSVFMLLSSILLIVIGENKSLYPVTVTSSMHVGNSLCLSPECIKVAATILSDINTDVPPCEDFYKYSCGGWEALNPIPDGHSSWSMFEKLWEGNQLVMKNTLEEDFNDVPDVNAKFKAHLYYMSCMDTNGTIEELSGKPLLNIIRTHLGSWTMLQKEPEVDSAGEDDEDSEDNLRETFTSKVARIHHELQSDGFYTWVVGEDDHNSSLHVIQLDQVRHYSF